jgi:hypothetical protein
VTDRGPRDEAQTFDRVNQHKFLAHILRSISDVVERKTGRDWDFGEPLQTVRQEVLALCHTQRETPRADVKIEAEALQAELTYQLRDHRLTRLWPFSPQPDSRKMAARRGPHGRGVGG